MYLLLFIFNFDMIRFFLKSFYFLLFFAVFYTVGIYIAGRLLPTELRPNLKHSNGMYGSTKNMLLDAEQCKGTEILVIGASDAYRGYDPRIFSEYGLRMFNMGTSSQTPKQTLLLLERYLPVLKPSLILYEVSPVCMKLDGVESTLDLMVNDFDSDLTAKLVFNDPDILLFNSFLYSLINNKLFFGAKRNAAFFSPVEEYITQGFVETKMKYNKREHIDSSVWGPSPEQAERLDMVYKTANKYGVNVLLVNANSITDRYFINRDSINTFFESKGEYLDLNSRLTLNDTIDFFDNSHLNSNGVKTMNNYLIPNILKRSGK